jgi:DNA polymerase III delta prime subunit
MHSPPSHYYLLLFLPLPPKHIPLLFSNSLSLRFSSLRQARFHTHKTQAKTRVRYILILQILILDIKREDKTS